MDTGITGWKKSKNSKSRRTWTRKEEQALLTALKDLCAKEWRCDNGTFRPGYIAVLEKKMALAFPETDLKENPHIDSKIKIWKKHYNIITTMLMTSGFGFNETDMVIEVDSNDIWEEYKKKDPEASGMRNKPFSYYNSWCIIFGKDRATGEHAEGPTDVEHAFANDFNGNDDGPINLTCLNDDQVPPVQPPQNKNDSKAANRKRPRNNDGIASGITRMADSMNSFVEKTTTQLSNIASRIGFQYDLSTKRQLLQQELATWPHITFQDRLKVIPFFVHSVENMDMFFNMTDVEKMSWVETLLAPPAAP